MDKKLFLILTLFSLLMNLGSVFFIREMIWSIVWCDKGGKYNHLRRLKRDQTRMAKWNMAYLREHTNEHTKAFDFWLTLKRIHSGFFALGFLLTVILIFVYNYIATFANVYCMVYTIITFLFTVCFALQTDTKHKQHYTKYDRERIRKKNSRKG